MDLLTFIDQQPGWILILAGIGLVSAFIVLCVFVERQIEDDETYFNNYD
jgi:hypothetical protein